jgi:hypothetical protein
MVTASFVENPLQARLYNYDIAPGAALIERVDKESPPLVA